jgi:Protein of unknown function (DUF3604)
MRSVSVVGVAMLMVAGCGGQHEGPGTPAPTPVPPAVVSARQERDVATLARLVPAGEASTRPTKQVLFGDLHVHTTFSADAFVRTLPLLQGEGAHPPADACDFARFCSDLDFWSINDHSEALSPEHWQETKEAIRQCNAVADPKNPDVVAFLGWEWTQVGVTAKEHYGHKNVILKETAEDKVPARPISALDANLIAALRTTPPLRQRLMFPVLDFANRQRYYDFAKFQAELRDIPVCPAGVDTKDLPANCSEVALNPQELFEKLAQWGGESIVIPHGTTWGFYTPPGSSWDKQLTPAMQDPDRQTLIEVFSGHGNSEEYRDWKDIDHDAQGNPMCPAPTSNYLPCCWQAGEIIRSRCGDAPADECERRVAAARTNFLLGEAGGRMSVPATKIEDWKDCGVCRDCYLPAYNTRPQSSVQYIMALNRPENPPGEQKFTFGFIGSSDNHSARPGVGYKEHNRRRYTEAAGAKSADWRDRLIGGLANEHADPESRRFDMRNPPPDVQQFMVLDLERQASFFMTGGLVAVHAEDRTRDGIWSALKRREVYGTSGPRILLWFDLLNGPQGLLPMGGEARLAEAPKFRVRAVGSFKQRPGCPDSSRQAVGDDRLETLCRGECYNPSDERLRITRLEVVRIRRQKSEGEAVAPLIEDPWRSFECPNDPSGCEVRFDDPTFRGQERETLYYVRALQEPTDAVNASGLRCEYDAAGNCVQAHPCYGDYRTPYDDDCLAPNAERAWSSPLYLTPVS